ncbi:hypothetical protein PSPO01_15801 [Paraphaeosphaeria sporulosa]
MVSVIADSVVVPEMVRRLLGWLSGGVRAISAYVGEPSEATCILDSCVSRLLASASACAFVSTNWAFTCESSAVNFSTVARSAAWLFMSSPTVALSSVLPFLSSSITASMTANVSLVDAFLPLSTPFPFLIVAPGIARVRTARGAPGASVSVSVR